MWNAVRETILQFRHLGLSQTSQLPQRDGQHRKIKGSSGLKIREHQAAASQCALVLRFPLAEELVWHFHFGAKLQNQDGKLPLQTGDIVSDRRFGKRLPMGIRR
jgi:hypothetical protein